MKKRILYVVHRYAPYPGGSENYVRDLAEETFRQGHDVTVFAGEHKGDLNGVKVTGAPSCLFEQWDLIVVHGGDVHVQNFVLERASTIPSPILYLLILPSDSSVCVKALSDVKYIGCSTPADWRHAYKYNVSHKCVPVIHSINPSISTGVSGFKEKYGIKTPYMFLSSGGYWPNKAFHELIDSFNSAKLEDVTLVLTGYDNRNQIMPPDSINVRTLLIDDRQDVLNAIYESDLYILNSHSEGFGLVLLEAMYNKTPWAARNIAGAELMKNYGFTYDTQSQLVEYLKNFLPVQPKDSYFHLQKYVLGTHVTSRTVSDILRVTL